MNNDKTLLLATLFVVGIFIAINSHAQSFLTNGLVAYYPFNGNANDTAGTNNGTVQGATLTTDRFNKANSAYYFNGNSWIETTQYRLLDGASNATISVWAMINSGTNGQILSCGDYRGGLDPISLHFMNQNADAMWFQNTLLGNVQNSQIGISNAPNSLPHFTATPSSRLQPPRCGRSCARS